MNLAMYHPGRNFLTVSITGDRCELMCQHCRGRFLRHMADAESPEELWDMALEEKARGIKGMLISGGADKCGAVPILPYLDIINKIKNKLNISINLHTGFISIEDIPKLAGKGIDIVSFDVIGSSEALRNVYGIEKPGDYFHRALEAFKDNGLRVVPHITVGLDRGGDSGEERALKIIARHVPDFLVVNALMSSEGSEKAGLRMPEVLGMARRLLPETPIGIGCMRPRGDILDPGIIESLGIVSIAMPSKALVEELEKRKIEIIRQDGCCCFFI